MPTVLELSSEERQRFIESARRVWAGASAWRAADGERQEVMARARAAASRLKEVYGVKRVILFGSFAHQAWESAAADIDIAVEGLPPQDYWRAWRDVERIVGDRAVDLVDVETACAGIREALGRHGIEL